VLYDFITPFFFHKYRFEYESRELDDWSLTNSGATGDGYFGQDAWGGRISSGYYVMAGALLLGVSMVPRVEINMVIMQRGLDLGDRAVPSHVFSAMVVLSMVTAIVSPIILRPLLKRWHPRKV